MIGQIRSYISLMDENSTDEYIDRINNMINDLPDDPDKASVLSSYLIRKNQIEQIKKYKKNKQSIETIDISPPTIDDIKEQVYEKIRNEEIQNEADINKRVDDYLYKKNEQSSKTKNVPINIKPKDLINLGKRKTILIRDMLRSKIKKEQSKSVTFDRGMPVLPIMEEEKKKETSEYIVDGIYMGSDDIKWVFEKNKFYKMDDTNKTLCNYEFVIDNTVLTLIDNKGNREIYNIIKNEDNTYNLYNNNKLIDKLEYLKGLD